MSTPKRFELLPTNGFDIRKLIRVKRALTTRPERQYKIQNLGVQYDSYRLTRKGETGHIAEARVVVNLEVKQGTRDHRIRSADSLVREEMVNEWSSDVEGPHEA
jgi:hypothetical protein